jgi:NAD(P)-dependent dehydrogenase (short-subunit alcohol dehydrogenase family)
MDLQLTGKTARVTGASLGIRRAIALGLAREGVRTAITARRVNLLEELAREIVSARGAEPLGIESDLDQMGRLGEPEKLANLAVSLASPRIGHITGTVTPVDGGMSRFAF